ncbi:E3 ubiquitin-protein ligase ATL4-like protein [Cinnamomum micranthum f. kanehirae]|uniref:E3 ubiquitin-protein ligase ATL4-like protein n=1 Tax=Cinnamomum micranthum f. kanehirae TaxID=337451 RepID=A0A443NEK5_9MAGN|nr:E3 ubiquitin-protein ligase ATL4-like protein [Cinnamomum micranthum f. kanehirae]
MVSVEYSGQVIAHLINKAALVVTILRWVMCWAFRQKDRDLGPSDFPRMDMGPPPSSSSLSSLSSSSSPPPPSSSQAIRDSLHVAIYGDISERLPVSSATCAVCLNDLHDEDKVWVLRNCCHVFHKRCLDRWLDHDEHQTCPLCRAPLLGQDLGLEPERPSWAVEQLIYLFGDDLLVDQ